MVEWHNELDGALSQTPVEKDILRYVMDYSKRESYSFDPRQVLSGLSAYITSKDGEQLKAYEIKMKISQLAKESKMNFALRQC